MVTIHNPQFYTTLLSDRPAMHKKCIWSWTHRLIVVMMMTLRNSVSKQHSTCDTSLYCFVPLVFIGQIRTMQCSPFIFSFQPWTVPHISSLQESFHWMLVIITNCISLFHSNKMGWTSTSAPPWRRMLDLDHNGGFYVTQHTTGCCYADILQRNSSWPADRKGGGQQISAKLLPCSLLCVWFAGRN
jgi:hypothetical protein